MTKGASQAAPYSLPVFTHHETISAAPVTAVSTQAARFEPSEAEISYQCLHMRMTLASSKSVQKIKSQEPRLWPVLRLLALTAARAFPKVMALVPCYGAMIGMVEQARRLLQVDDENQWIDVTHVVTLR